MKKTIRTITAALLIAIIALGTSLSAFAATAGSIVWTDTEADYSRLFVYGGHPLETGRTEIRNNSAEDDLVYFDFKVEKEGYYYIDTENNSWVMIPEVAGSGKVYDYREAETVGEDEERLFWLDEGKTVIGINFYDQSSDEIAIMFCGEEVEDYTVEEAALQNYIIGWNIWECDCDDCAKYFWVNTDTVITFSSGITLEIEDYCFYGTCTTSPAEGTGKATLDFMGKKKEVEFTAFYIDSIVESVEMTNVENYLDAEVGYDGWYYTKEVAGETLTVHFKDGTSYTAILEDCYCDVELPDGKTVGAWVGEYWEEGSDETEEVYFAIYVANKAFEKRNYNTERKPLGENLLMLYEDNKRTLEWAKNDFGYMLENLATDPESAMNNLYWSVDEFIQAFRNIITFVKFYMTIV